MKRNVIATLIAALILFFWQFLSQAALDLHKSEHLYTPHQDSILNMLSATGLKEGKYVMPLQDPTLGYEAQMKYAKEQVGKPMAILDYKVSNDANMGMNILRGILVNILIMYLFITLLRRSSLTNFKSILFASLIVGFIGFLNHAYTNYIWYHSTDIFIDLVDAFVGWGFSGVWLGYYLKD